MKRIVLAVNAHQLNGNIVNFACYLAKQSESVLTALFLGDTNPEPVNPGDFKKSYYEEVTDVSLKAKPVSMDVDQATHLFIDFCKAQHVPFDIQLNAKAPKHNKPPIDETVTESRFADLLILDAETSFRKHLEPVPTHFIKGVVAHAECPVVIAPAIPASIDEVVFCYDGGQSSVFAMKQFAYLFPELSDKKIMVLEVGDYTHRLIHKEKLSAWLQNYYSHFSFETLEGEAGDELFKFLLLKKNIFVVLGAYGRNMLSGFFKKSSADLIMRTADFPLFISHH